MKQMCLKQLNDFRVVAVTMDVGRTEQTQTLGGCMRANQLLIADQQTSGCVVRQWLGI